MPEIVILADDLTGANATNVLLSRKGYKAATFLKLDDNQGKQDDHFNVIAITTDSRSIPRRDAYEKVENVVKFFKEKNVKLFSKRIDSTLRGNIGAEMDAVLDTLGEDTLAIVVSSFPSSGRVTIGGYLMVNSVPLENTDVAKDPKTPVHTSFVPKLVEEQTKYPVDFISLENILKGVDWLKEIIIESKEKGNRVLVMDATTNEDIDVIAKAVKMTELPVIAVDPGPFTASLSNELLGQATVIPGQKIMLTVGSVTNLTRKQLSELKIKHAPLFVSVNSKALIYEGSRSGEIQRVVDKVLKDMINEQVIGVMTTTEEEEVLNLRRIAEELKITEDQVSQRISDGLAEITVKVLEESATLIGGLFTSGGDVTVAVCHALSAKGIKVKDEVLPLAAYGRLIGGNYDNVPIITKGGLVGEQDAIIKCVDYLLTKVSNEYHQNI